MLARSESTAVPFRQITEERAAGHACGHHLFGAASASTAVALSQWLLDSKVNATIKLVGTPAEEGGSGKVYLARAGVFDGVDVVLTGIPVTPTRHLRRVPRRISPDALPSQVGRPTQRLHRIGGDRHWMAWKP